MIIEPVGTVFTVRWDGMEDSIEAVYADLRSAQLWVPEDYKDWMRYGDPGFIPGIFSWIAIGKFMWHLYENGSPVGIVVTQEIVNKVTGIG
jgi:hypothetical protein